MEENQEQPSMATGFFRSGNNPKLPADAGLHRFKWDLRHQTLGARSYGGPMVSPGQYVARLTIGDQIMEQSFEVKIDPRIEKSGITIDDLKKQEVLALKVQRLRAKSGQMASKVSKALERDNKNEQLQQLDQALSTADGRYMTPMIVDQLRYLSSMIDRADQLPGKDAFDRYEELKAKVKELEPNYKAIFKETVSSPDE